MCAILCNAMQLSFLFFSFFLDVDTASTVDVKHMSSIITGLNAQGEA